MRFPLEVFDAVRAAVPDDYPVTIRVSGTDWVEGGWDIQGTIALARAVHQRGCTAYHVSSGGLDPRQRIAAVPNYQVPLARAVKEAVPDMPVIAVGLITEPHQAEAIVATGDADMIAIARAALYDPRWPWHAAAALGERASRRQAIGATIGTAGLAIGLALKDSLSNIASGVFSPGEPDRYRGLVQALTEHDRFMIAADFPSYGERQAEVAAAWRDKPRWWRSSVLNTAAAGWSSSDRTIAEYAADIWRVPVPGR